MQSPANKSVQYFVFHKLRPARRYTIRKISEMLADSYEQYQLNVSMNISFPCKEVGHMLAAKKTITDDILSGRKLNGEPEDLNF